MANGSNYQDGENRTHSVGMPTTGGTRVTSLDSTRDHRLALEDQISLAKDSSHRIANSGTSTRPAKDGWLLTAQLKWRSKRRRKEELEKLEKLKYEGEPGSHFSDDPLSDEDGK